MVTAGWYRVTSLWVTTVDICMAWNRSYPFTGSRDAQTVAAGVQDSVNPPWPSELRVGLWTVTCFLNVAGGYGQLPTAVHHPVRAVELGGCPGAGFMASSHMPALLVQAGECG